MLAIIESLFWRDPSKNHSNVTLQAYLVPFGFEIAIIFSPVYYRSCKWANIKLDLRRRQCLFSIRKRTRKH